MDRASLRVAAVLTAAAFLVACSTTTTITGVPAGMTLDVKTSSQTTLPRTEKYQVTTFGNFEFRAQAPGLEPLYGRLPLKFNGGYLALDIIFFTPLAFGNLRAVYPYYEVDLEQRVVRFKRKETDPWTVYTPNAAMSEQAKVVLAK